MGPAIFTGETRKPETLPVPVRWMEISQKQPGELALNTKGDLSMQTEATALSEFFGDLIYSYSRADAIADGVLIPVSSELCTDAGIKFPVCVTETIWNGYIEPYYLPQLPGQSVEGRLWDLLWMFHLAVKAGNGTGDRIRYQVYFLTQVSEEPELIDLIAVCGPGDMGEPVITIMLPGED